MPLCQMFKDQNSYELNCMQLMIRSKRQAKIRCRPQKCVLFFVLQRKNFIYYLFMESNLFRIDFYIWIQESRSLRKSQNEIHMLINLNES